MIDNAMFEVSGYALALPPVGAAKQGDGLETRSHKPSHEAFPMFFPPEVDRAFVVEALCTAGDHFGTLAQQSADAQIREEYDIKRARCLRLAFDLEGDLDVAQQRSLLVANLDDVAQM
jgi:hypothetical protein